MLINFFMTLKHERLPVSFTELFALLECLKQNIAFGDVDEFYHVARLCLVKDEKHFDKFDRAFSKYFEQLDLIDDLSLYQIPEQWLKKQFENSLSDEEKAQIEAMGGLEKLLEAFRKRMEEQEKGIKGGINGSVPEVHPLSARLATTLKAFALVKTKAGTTGQSKYGTGAITATLMIRLRSGHAISKWLCADYASSQEQGQTKNWIWMIRFLPLPEMPGCWTSRWFRRGGTLSRCCFFLTSVVRWILM